MKIVIGKTDIISFIKSVCMITKNTDILYIKFEKNYFNKGDIIDAGNNFRLKVLQTPHKKWYKQLLQFVSFSLYKVPTQYKCKVE